MEERKVRSDSKLKNLPEERQQHIFELCSQKSFAEVREVLAEDGLKTSATALKSFFRWYSLRSDFEETGSLVDEFCDLLKKEVPSLPEDQVFSYGQSAFSMLALRQGDTEAWARVQKLALKKRDQQLHERRITLLEQQAALAQKAQTAVQDSNLTPEQLQAKLREIFNLS